MNKKKVLFVTGEVLEGNTSSMVRNTAMLLGLSNKGYIIHTVSLSLKNEKEIPTGNVNLLNIEKRYYVSRKSFISKLNKKIDNLDSLMFRIKIIIGKLYSKIRIYGVREDMLKSIDNVKLSGYYDFILSSSDPKISHLIAKKIIEKHPNKFNKWIQYWGDPFYLDINSKRIFFNYRIKKEEYSLLLRADKVIYVSPLTIEEQKRLFPKMKEKMFFLPTPFIDTKIYKHKYGKKIIFGYYGDYHINIRNILPFYKVAKKQKRFNFEIIGDSEISLDTEKNIVVDKRISYEEFKKHESECDILVCICNKTGTQIPGKAFHYAATNKPILLIVDGNKKKIKFYFNKFNRYIICDNNENSITEAINNISKSLDKKVYPLLDFSCDTVTEKLLNLVNK